MLKKIFTKSSLLLGISIFVASCGDTNKTNSDSNDNFENWPDGTPRPLITANEFINVTDLEKLSVVSLVYNGFNAKKADYEAIPTAQSTPQAALIEDLSAMQTKNLYPAHYYKQSLEGKTSPTTTNISLPGSGLALRDVTTLLSPSLSMFHVHGDRSATTNREKFPVVPTATHPVFLSVPSGTEAKPEAPFFPAISKYTYVVAMHNEEEGGPENSAVFSIESQTGTGVTFGAFAHFPGKDLTLRVYDSASTLETPQTGVDDYVLLSESSTPATINARFLNLTSDNLPSDKLILKALSLDEFKTLGHVDGAGYKHWMLLPYLHQLFPHLLEEKGEGSNRQIRNKYNPEFGVFSLGGNNTFKEVELRDRAFLYPMSGESINTRVQTLTVDASSGFLTETGKQIQIDTLNGSNTLLVIPVLSDSSATGPIVKINTLKGVTTLNTTLGHVNPDYTLPDGGVILLEHANEPEGVITASKMIDTHSGGVAYDGEVEYTDKKLKLTTLTKKSAAGLGSGAMARLIAHHPQTQGIPLQQVVSLSSALDPISGAQQSTHTLNNLEAMNLFTPNFNNQITNSTTGSFTQTASGIAGNLSIMMAESPLAKVTSNMHYSLENENNLSWGLNAAAKHNINIGRSTFSPYISAGYVNYALQAQSINAGGLSLNTSKINAHALTLKVATSVTFTPSTETSVKLNAGLEHQFGSIYNGTATMIHDSVMLNGERFNSLHIFANARFKTNTSFITFGLYNLDQINIQFGITH